MVAFTPSDPAFADRVRLSFGQQRVMTTLGASLVAVAPGEVVVALPFSERLTQHNGFLHAGIVTTIVDSACGYAALTLMPSGQDVLTVEYAVKFLNPARGERFRATGRVVKSGRTLTFCAGEVVAWDAAGRERVVITMTATMMAMPPRPAVAE